MARLPSQHMTPGQPLKPSGLSERASKESGPDYRGAEEISMQVSKTHSPLDPSIVFLSCISGLHTAITGHSQGCKFGMAGMWRENK